MQTEFEQIGMKIEGKVSNIQDQIEQSKSDMVKLFVSLIIIISVYSFTLFNNNNKEIVVRLTGYNSSIP